MSARGCGCCECLRSTTPIPVVNRAGLSSIVYRAGTHATFLETMLARLSSRTVASLAPLTTRDPADPSIAFLDAWAVAADVLTFYNERIANEGYLRTAIERRSLVNLGRLVGYELRPGVAASAYVAYTIDTEAETEIPAGARVQSVPGPEDEGPRTFETSDALKASWLWNEIRPRVTTPQKIGLTAGTVYTVMRLYLSGTATNLRSRDLLLFVFGSEERRQVVRAVQAVTPDFDNDRTLVELVPSPPRLRVYGELLEKTKTHLSAPAEHLGKTLDGERALLSLTGPVLGVTAVEARMDALQKTLEDEPNAVAAHDFFKQELAEIRAVQPSSAPAGTVFSFGDVISQLKVPLSEQPASSRRLSRTLDPLAQGTEVNAKLLQTIVPEIKANYAAAYANVVLTPDTSEVPEVYALREVAALFGFNAPRVIVSTTFDPDTHKTTIDDREQFVAAIDDDQLSIHLDNIYDVAPESWALIRPQNAIDIRVVPIESVETVVRSNYSLNQKVTRLTLSRPWIGELEQNLSNAAATATDIDFTVIRNTTVLVRSELLPLAEEPLETDIEGTTIVLDGYYPGLQKGRWVILIGERTDIPLTTGVIDHELLMISDITHPSAKGETPHTELTFAVELAYTYKRSTVILKGNVVHATDGDSRDEVLGGGDATKSLQQFTLRTSPLTYVSAVTPSGIASTLIVRVNDVQWDEVESFTGLGPTARVFTTKTSDDAKTTLTFGTGVRGARLPTGAGNVTARYRKDLGRGGNLNAGQLTNPLTKPLGVKAVDNPIPASGGADAETRDQARENIPVALHALDRLVSVRDYADFSRTFAGVTKAAAIALPGKLAQIVHVTIAGDGDSLITESSDLYTNLKTALLKYGDVAHQIVLASRERIVVTLKARVRIDSHYLWDKVEPDIRATLNDRFGFERRALGQTLFAGEIIAAIHNVPGVDYVDLEVFDGISTTEIVPQTSAAAAASTAGPSAAIALGGSAPVSVRDCIRARPARIEQRKLRAAQIAYIAAEVEDTVVLQEIDE